MTAPGPAPDRERGHRMLPGSHEQPSGPECRCGAPWDRWNDRCTSHGDWCGPGSHCMCADRDREHTAECYEHGCTTGSHPAPRPGHVTGGPWTPEELVSADRDRATREAEAREEIARRLDQADLFADAEVSR